MWKNIKFKNTKLWIVAKIKKLYRALQKNIVIILIIITTIYMILANLMGYQKDIICKIKC